MSEFLRQEPSRPRRYCLIDGRDSLRLLMAYDKLDRAPKLSEGPRRASSADSLRFRYGEPC